MTDKHIPFGTHPAPAMSNAQKVSDERLPKLSDDLYEAYPAMSAQTHEAQVKDYARQCLALRAVPTPDAHSEVGVKDIARIIAQLRSVANERVYAHMDQNAEDRIEWEAADILQALTAGVVKAEPVACERCQGNGEIVTDWERYQHGPSTDKGDEAVEECPDCDGTGAITADLGGCRLVPTEPTEAMIQAFLKPWPVPSVPFLTCYASMLSAIQTPDISAAVAWQVKGDDGVWRYVEMPKTARAMGMETRPLFAAPALTAGAVKGEPVSFQGRVAAANIPLFHDDPTDLAERRDRFYEEATETVQSLGMTADDAHALVEYTFGRAPGDVRKEIGAAALTLASLCVVGGWDMMACAEADLAALQTPEKIAKVRAKRATRHGRGPLPGLNAALASKPQGER